jgi:hypothetical protein
MQVEATLPAAKWPTAARLLAQLESIKRVELSHAATITDAAYDLVNSVRVAPAPLNEGEPQTQSEAQQSGHAGHNPSPATPSGQAKFANEPTASLSRPTVPQRKAWPLADDSVPFARSALQASRVRRRPGKNAERIEAKDGGMEGSAENVPRAAVQEGLAATRLPSGGALESWPCAQSDLRQLRELQASADQEPLTQEEAARLDALFMRRLIALAEEAHFAGTCSVFGRRATLVKPLFH